jgi:predicted enzyme related to lactoylglutathione lyase
MKQTLAQIAIVVRDYDEAIAWYTRCLDWILKEDIDLGTGKRWVILKPPGEEGAGLLLAKAATPEQLAAVGNQTGGRVFLFLHTDDFHSDYERMKQRGVTFLSEPRTESYGTVAVFVDLYGNKWDLIEKRVVTG